MGVIFKAYVEYISDNKIKKASPIFAGLCSLDKTTYNLSLNTKAKQICTFEIR